MACRAIIFAIFFFICYILFVKMELPFKQENKSEYLHTQKKNKKQLGHKISNCVTASSILGAIHF